jgi:hypothetical protein
LASLKLAAPNDRSIASELVALAAGTRNEPTRQARSVAQSGLPDVVVIHAEVMSDLV